MDLAYVDTSCLVAIAFREPGSAALQRRLSRFDELFAANLLEAELRSALRSEGVPDEPVLLQAISWVVPDRPLHREIGRVLETGYLRGADCWHLATALYLAGDPASLAFVTLDESQSEVAARLGFPTR